ncbi:MAG TPA: hypothetical protein VIJ38_01155 [Acidobacteriaceae bacterium]
MPYASSNNAVLINNCQNLQNLSVLLEVTEDIATTNGGGWSLQLNSFPPAGEYCQTSQLNWLQYIVIAQGGNLSYYIQYWALGASTWPPGYTAQSGTTPWLPCWAHDYGNAPNFASITADTLPRQSTLQIQLNTNGSGGVVSVTFTYTDPDGNAHPATWQAPVVHPIVGFELNFVGAPGGNATFTQGLTSSRGIIYYSVSSGQLSVQSGGPGSACGEYSGAVTGELSNMTYSDINGAPASTVTQILQQPVQCAVTSMALADPAGLDKMKQLRDSTVAQYPAGQWLMGVLDRHSADLSVLAGDNGDIRQAAQDLLAKATQIVDQKGTFDEATVDGALKLLGQVSGKLPPSMNGVAAAGATVLASLRGKTLEDGLTEASKTILPRFKAPPPRASSVTFSGRP